MRAVVVLAVVAACTLHVEMDVRSVPVAAQASTPWKSPAVGVTNSGECNALSATHNIFCAVDQWGVLDSTTCTMKCEPMPAFLSGIANVLPLGATVVW